MLQDRSLGELEAREGVVVKRDKGVFVAQGNSPFALGFQQNVQGSPAGEEVLIACRQFLRRRFAVASLDFDLLMEFIDLAKS